MFVKLASYVKKEVNSGKPLIKLSELHSLYESRLEDLGNAKSVNKTRLKERLLEYFKEAQEQFDGRKTFLVFKEGMRNMIQDALKKRDFSEDALVLARAASIIRKDIFNHEGILLEGCLSSGKELKTLQHQCSVHQPWYKKGNKHYQSFTRFLYATQPLLFGEKGRSRSGKLGWRLKRLQTLLCTYNPGQN